MTRTITETTFFQRQRDQNCSDEDDQAPRHVSSRRRRQYQTMNAEWKNPKILIPALKHPYDWAEIGESVPLPIAVPVLLSL